MSEFFKALEQAERDRLRQEHADTTPAPRTSPPATEPHVAKESSSHVAKESSPHVAKESSSHVAKESSPHVAKESSPHVAKESSPQPSVARSSPVDATFQKASPPPLLPPSSPATVFRTSLRVSHLKGFVQRAAGRAPVLVTQIDPGSVAADAYRTVRANIELMSESGPLRRIMITSAAGGDGKSTSAANLAVVGAQAGRRVCLIDADLRHPTLHDVFGLPNVDGFAAALEQGKPVHAVARPTDIDNLSVVVAGRGSEAFQDLVTPHRLDQVFREMTTAFDLIIFDGPPVIVSDTLTIAAMCDGVILVVRAGTMPFAALQRAIGQIRQVRGRVLGVLLNQADRRASEGHGYRHYRAYHSNGSKG
jgi:capsular exopolysaccharide synthesis family protein